MSAKQRASLALVATTDHDTEFVFGLVKGATEAVRGGGGSLLTTGLQNIGAQVHVEAERPDRLLMSINSGTRIFELCTFSAVATDSGSGRTKLRVGGLETYKTTQSKMYGLIPIGPKRIAGMSPYKRFLEEVAQALRAVDAGADIAITEPAR